MHPLNMPSYLFFASSAIVTPFGDIAARAACGKAAQTAFSCINNAAAVAATSFYSSYISTSTKTTTVTNTV